MADAKHGVEVSLHIGQRVSHLDHLGKRVTGIINGLQVDTDQGLVATVILDEPIIIPARGEGDRAVTIHWQTAPVTEFSPFDDRDELIAELQAALRQALGRPDAARLGGTEISDEHILATWNAWPRQGITSRARAIEFVRAVISNAASSLASSVAQATEIAS